MLKRSGKGQNRNYHTGNKPRRRNLTKTQELRQRRLKRYRQRRSVLRSSPLISMSPENKESPYQKKRSKTVLGITQAKRSKRQVCKPKRQAPVSTRSRRFPQYRQKQRRREIETSHYLRRFFFLSLGVVVVAGAAIAVLRLQGTAPITQTVLPFSPTNSKTQPNADSEPTHSKVDDDSSLLIPTEGKELRQLKQEIQGLISQQSGLTPGLFFMNPETHEYVNVKGEEAFPAASTIKLPILIAFFQDVDAGKIRLDEKLVMRPDLIASESGAMQYDEPGTQYNALKTADAMITISDNTATNMLIDRLGGIKQLNERFASWGLTHTKINQPLPDLEGQNIMSPKDFAFLMMKVGQGELLTAHSRDRALEILRNTVTRTLLPQGIAENALIAHKTGDIGSSVGDVGLIDMPNGQRYVGAIMVKRPHNDPRAQELIRQISRLVYQTYEERSAKAVRVPHRPLKPIP